MLGRMLMRLKTLLSVLTGLGVAMVCAGSPTSASALPSNCSRSTATVSCAYFYAGSEQSFAVPAGVRHATITAIGAPGGFSGGNGATVRATVPVPRATSTLYVEVGGSGSSGGFNGGGSATSPAGTGGGASDVRTCSSTICSLSSNDTRLVVAGGGGGASGHGCTGLPAAGSAGDSTVSGAGAGGAGSDTCPSDNGAGGDGGFGGTTGGQGGAGTAEFACNGGDGSLGQGGSAPASCDPANVGGGGGGGYWGGGAGGDGNDIGGAGGAGSSYWIKGATHTSMSEDTTGTPEVIIAYTVPQPDMTLTNSASPSTVAVGNKLTYTIKATNTGKATAKGIKLSDALPASVRFKAVSTSLGTCKHVAGPHGKGGTVTCNVSSLGAGKRLTVTVTVTPTKTGTLSDTATATASNVKADADDTATAVSTVKPGA